MTEQQTEEQKAVQYEVHEMALQFPAQKPDEKAQLRDSMIQRVHQGLGPLEFPILLVGGKIADGRHRYQIWQDLAADGACDGYFAKNQPAVEESEEDEAVVLLRINARNLHHRTLSADQKAAIFLMQVEKHPTLKQLVEKVQAENQERMKAGKSVDGKSQGTTTNEQLAKLAGDVSSSTMKNVKSVQKHAPERLPDVASGKMSAKAALKKAPKANQSNTGSKEDQGKKPPKRKSPIDLGPKRNASLTALTVVGLGEIGQIAEVREFFSDHRITFDVQREEEGTVFTFDGTALNQRDTLTFLGTLVAARGPFKLSIHLDAIPMASPVRNDRDGGISHHELQRSSASS